MNRDARRHISRVAATLAVVVSSGLLISCSGRTVTAAAPPDAERPEVGVVPVARKTLQRTLVVSSELVPFQRIEVYAKEAGFVRTLTVDYGSRVRKGAVMAVLEIPELQAQIQEDEAAVKAATGQVSGARQALARVQAQQSATHLQASRLGQVAKANPGLVAQQEVDDWQSRDQAASAQVAGAQSALDAATSELARAQARQHHDEVLFGYSRIIAPFDGVVTKRYANLGTLMQSGMNSSKQAMPLVQLSEEDLYRLVIPVPESYVPDIKVGDPVSVRVPTLNRTFPGKVARSSVDIDADTRTMHTEVDVPNPAGVLTPGMYAEATVTLNHNTRVLSVPQEAVNVDNDKRSVWVIDATGEAHLQPVTLGVETPDDVEVLSGLTEGQLVAVGDRSRLRAGEKVRTKRVQLLRYRG